MKKGKHVPVINITRFAKRMGLGYRRVVVTEPLWDAMVALSQSNVSFHDVLTHMLSTLARTIQHVGIGHCHLVGVAYAQRLLSVSVTFKKGHLRLDYVPTVKES